MTKPKAQAKKSTSQLFHEWAQATTCHGVKDAVESSGKTGRSIMGLRHCSASGYSFLSALQDHRPVWKG